MKTVTCFLIDDDLDDQDVFLETIEGISSSIKCFTAIDGRQALNRLLHENFRPDLIVLDLNMPVMSGEQFLRELSKHEEIRDTPIVIYSTVAKAVKFPNGINIKGLVTKPDTVMGWDRELRSCVGKILGSLKDAEQPAKQFSMIG